MQMQMRKHSQQHPSPPPNQIPQIRTHYHNWNCQDHQNQPLHPKQNRPITTKKKKKNKKNKHTHTHKHKQTRIKTHQNYPQQQPKKRRNLELKPITH